MVERFTGIVEDAIVSIKKLSEQNIALTARVAKLENALKEQELRAQYWEKEANRAPGQMLHMTVGKDERGQQCFTHMSCEEWVSAALAATKEPKP